MIAWLTRRRLVLWASLSVVAVLTYLRCGPLPRGLLDLDARASTVVVDRHGEQLYEARSSRGTRGVELDAAHLPQPIVAATMAAEDERFRRHPGIDLIAVGRAIVRDIRAQRVV